MTTCADLINETRRLMFSSTREVLNSLTNPLDASETILTFARDLGVMQAGSTLAVDLELMYVWEVNANTKTATVERGYLGSAAATHTAASLVYIDSKFPAFAIFQAINQDIADLSAPRSGLYQVFSDSFAYNPAIQGYQLTPPNAGGIIDVLQVTAQIPGPSKDWVPLRAWRLDTQAVSSDFGTGISITLYEPGSAGLLVQVVFACPFTPFAALTDAATSSGLAESALDLPPLGAGMRLTGVREIARNFFESQGDTRRESAVPPNAQLAGYQALARERARRIKSEAQKLASTWPTMRKF